MSEEFENPIDKDNVTDIPSLLPYAHHRGSVAIKPEDKGKIKSKALAAMYEQTDMQMSQLYKQMELLVEQAKKLKNRKEISEIIYNAALGFDPLIGHTYHLYQRKNGQYLLSIVAPNEWGRSIPFERFCATVRLLAAHTWDILEGEVVVEVTEED